MESNCKLIPYPHSIKVGGQAIEVRDVERCSNNNVGEAHVCGGFIEIADKFNKEEIQSADSKRNTFFYEMIHVILANMGENELNDNEKFVCSFAGFLTEAMADAKFIESKESEE
ncbi:MAG: hypothetical protein NC226_09455 [Bacteroides cellulosilyticus]|nr:hypothetical protein [Bacteroides cellulosilyticus]